MKTSIKKMKLADLIPTENNPRQIKKDDFERLKKSIKSFPKMLDIREIVVDENNRILGGHQRVKALLANGETEVSVKVVEGLSEEEKREFVIRDNIQNGEWDFEVLANEWDDLPLDDWGIELPIADIEEEIVEDEAPEPPAEPKSKLGEIYQLGEHRLMCGDSTDAEQVAKLMNGRMADLVFTDPPYGMKKEGEGILNDNLNFDDLLEFNKKWIPLSFDNLKGNGSWYCWGIDEPLMDIYSNILKPMARESKITFRNLITWDKGDAGAGGVSFMGKDGLRSYPVGSEKCLFVMCGVQGFNNNQDNYFEGFEPIRAYLEAECAKCGGHKVWKQMLGNNMGHHYFTKSQWCFPTEEAYEKMQAFGKEYGAFGKEYEEIKKEYEEIKKEYEEIKKEWYETRAYFDNTHDTMTDVWAMGRISHEEKTQAGGHATPKPIALCSRAIKSSSRENELVLDVFGGSGSTLITCEQLRRKCYMMELDPHYVDVIIERWENLTGKKAKLIEEK